MVDAATQFRKNGYNDEDATQLALVASREKGRIYGNIYKE